MDISRSPQAIFDILAPKLTQRSKAVERSKFGGQETFVAVGELNTKVTAAIAGGDFKDEVDVTIFPGSVVDDVPESKDQIDFGINGVRYQVQTGIEINQSSLFRFNSLAGSYDRVYGIEMGSAQEPGEGKNPPGGVPSSQRAIFGLLKASVGRAANHSHVLRSNVGSSSRLTVLEDLETKVNAAIVGGSPEDKIPVTILAGSRVDNRPETYDSIGFLLQGQDYFVSESRDWRGSDRVFELAHELYQDEERIYELSSEGEIAK